MRVKNIILKNIFAFNGRQEISFEKNTLILAENGFGKTSLLNSIKLALGQKRVQVDSILNSLAKDKECYIEIDFDEFTLTRVWDFTEDFESLTIHLNENILKDYEAEEFLKEKFPVELIDFIFFDGEVEKDLILLKSRKIKRVFEYVFDLDILSNMIVDTKKVANSISNRIGKEEVAEFVNLQQKEVELSDEIQKLEDNKRVKIRDNKKIDNLLRLNKLKISNRHKEIESVNEKIEENQLELTKYIEVFQEINLYQLPLLLNDEHFTKVKEEKTKSIDILDKKEFEKSFNSFLKQIDSSTSSTDALKYFHTIFNINSGISLNYKKEEVSTLLNRIKSLISQKESLLTQYEDIKQKLLKKGNLEQLEQDKISLEDNKKNQELELTMIQEKLKENIVEHKEIHKKLRLEFISKRDKYSKVKSIEELYNISSVTQKVYNEKLVESLNKFNELLSKKIIPFLEIYRHINKIYINSKFRVILEGINNEEFNIALFSAGQKQILSFIIISTILEFKRFVDFIFIDTPFGRLSNKSRDFIFNNYYLEFSNLNLLITSSEYDYLKDKKSEFKEYTIEQNSLGSIIKEAKDD